MSGEYLPQDPGFATKAIHVGQDPEQWPSCAVVPPISLSTTFKQDGPGQHRVREMFPLCKFTRIQHTDSSRPIIFKI